ncbi:hypothetical protein ERO13_D13G027850v2 [Gossypium hirsutum]|uniref:Uncharacterized protein n=1 Tax=Gossypium barbadense TaxID=3634 RepID=A0A5J5NGP6_GOSBA|nr:hypothetical protein ES319_D13G031900v1 [Gossypium barbadense]KAG4110094.1 hypothetical protein ERO13_D13G027850v2 [Gossypium hirsutum]
MLDHHSTMCTNKCCLSILYLQGEFNRAFQSDFYGGELMEAEWCSDRKQGARSKERRRMVETGSSMEGYQGNGE